MLSWGLHFLPLTPGTFPKRNASHWWSILCLPLSTQALPWSELAFTVSLAGSDGGDSSVQFREDWQRRGGIPCCGGHHTMNQAQTEYNDNRTKLGDLLFLCRTVHQSTSVTMPVPRWAAVPRTVNQNNHSPSPVLFSMCLTTGMEKRGEHKDFPRTGNSHMPMNKCRYLVCL